MPSKRPSPLENPPSATSSDSFEDEEEVEASQEEEETTPLKPSPKKHNSNSNPTPISKSHPSSSDEEDDDFGDDSDSDPDVPLENHTNSSAPLDIKPISSKPMVESSKPKKSTTIEAASALSKRKLETDEKDSSKKDKKKKVSDLVEEEEEDEAERKSGDEQKKLFQRLWSNDDEIVILKGINSFKKKGMDPSAQVTAFFDFIKESLRPDVNKVQLHSKIRGLKRKYYNATKRVVKNRAEDPKFSKPHEAKVYQLAKKAWGDEVGKDLEGEGKSVATDTAPASVTDGKKSKNKKITDGVAASSPNSKVTPSLINSPVAVKVEDGENSSDYTYMNGSLRSVSSLPIPPPALVEVFSNRGWDAIGTLNAKRFDQRWKDVMILETKAYLARIDLVKEQTQMMLGVLESLNQ